MVAVTRPYPRFPPPPQDGKEGVDGSSPSETFEKRERADAQPLGGRIVAEVLVGLIESDPASYLVRRPRWKPTLTSAGAGFRMVDFLAFAGVDPAGRGP